MKRIRRSLAVKFLARVCLGISLCSVLTWSTSGWAQDIYGDPMGDVTIVAASTVGGAVLGLSTLPFTDEPGDHLKNIYVGGAIGLIVGVAIVAYAQATQTPEQYYDKEGQREARPPRPGFSAQPPFLQQFSQLESPLSREGLSTSFASLPRLHFSWTF